ncbi:hypothetical protein A2U01_0084382, partial [Trifolium medium]|nr:hypothetical protein [Trifolium medium]
VAGFALLCSCASVKLCSDCDTG